METICLIYSCALRCHWPPCRPVLSSSVIGWTEHLQLVLHSADRLQQAGQPQRQVQQWQESRLHPTRPPHGGRRDEQQGSLLTGWVSSVVFHGVLLQVLLRLRRVGSSWNAELPGCSVAIVETFALNLKTLFFAKMWLPKKLFQVLFEPFWTFWGFAVL